MARKKQGSNIVGWVILVLMAFGIYHFGIAGNPDRSGGATSRASIASKPAAPTTAVPLNAPRFVNVASLNVRHTPSTSGPLVMTLPRGTALKVLDRRNGWLLVDINPTLEGWVAESLTTTENPSKRFAPPAALSSSR